MNLKFDAPKGNQYLIWQEREGWSNEIKKLNTLPKYHVSYFPRLPEEHKSTSNYS